MEAQSLDHRNKLLGLWSVVRKVLQNHQTVLGSLDAQCRLTSQHFHLLIQFEAVITRTWTEYTTTTAVDRRLHGTVTCATCSFLLVYFLGGASNFSALLGLVCTLTLVRQILLYIQVNSMFVGLNSKNTIVQGCLATRLFAQGGKNVQFHYFSTITMDCLAPGTEPFTINKFFSVSTFNTCKF